jgi:hypothetical protein
MKRHLPKLPFATDRGAARRGAWRRGDGGDRAADQTCTHNLGALAYLILDIGVKKACESRSPAMAPVTLPPRVLRVLCGLSDARSESPGVVRRKPPRLNSPIHVRHENIRDERASSKYLDLRSVIIQADVGQQPRLDRRLGLSISGRKNMVGVRFGSRRREL